MIHRIEGPSTLLRDGDIWVLGFNKYPSKDLSGLCFTHTYLLVLACCYMVQKLTGCKGGEGPW